MMSLNTKGSAAATDGATVGECLLDTLCVKYSGISAGLTIYEDSLYMNIIGEFSLKEFLKENQIRSPVVRTEYAEVQLVLVRHEQVTATIPSAYRLYHSQVCKW